MTARPAAHESPSPSRTRPESPLIVVIEDERPQQVVLTTALGAHGYRVEVAGTGVEGLQVVSSFEPDLVLLDLGLPDIDGIELCRHVRNIVDCPVLIVTADHLDARMVEALDLGADDYILKPFNLDVLLARIRVALRHRSALAPLRGDDVLVCGDVQIDVGAHQVLVGETIVELSARPFALITILVRNQGRVVGLPTLLRALESYGTDDFNAVRVLVSKLRKVLGTGPQRPTIETEVGVGYRLVGPDPETSE